VCVMMMIRALLDTKKVKKEEDRTGCVHKRVLFLITRYNVARAYLILSL